MLIEWETAYNEVLKEKIRHREEEREKFFMLFNIFCHEVKRVNPELFPVCLKLEELMNEAFGDLITERQQCI
ncbi:asparaginase [Paenibacillus popilliae]|nr:asparaginase [Paenibacillus popilliae]